MKYVCTFRDQTGAAAKRIVDAQSRSQALEELRQQGITPISLVADGDENRATRTKWSPSIVMMGVCLLALLGGTIIWYCLSQKTATPAVESGEKAKAKKIAKKQPPSSVEKKDLKESHVQKAEMSSPTVEETPVIQATNTVPHVRKFGEGRPVYTNMSAVLNKDRFDVFKHRAEFEMAALIMIKPGDTVIGDANYNKGFEKDLLACLDDPIDIDGADPEDVNELKRSVTEMKEEVRKMVAKGDNVRDVFTQARKELQELGIYKMNVEQNLREMLKSKDLLSEQDMEDCIKAANQMLEKKGIAPIQVGGLTKHLIKRRIERQKERMSAGQQK